MSASGGDCAISCRCVKNVGASLHRGDKICDSLTGSYTSPQWQHVPCQLLAANLWISPAKATRKRVNRRIWWECKTENYRFHYGETGNKTGFSCPHDLSVVPAIWKCKLEAFNVCESKQHVTKQQKIWYHIYCKLCTTLMHLLNLG